MTQSAMPDRQSSPQNILFEKLCGMWLSYAIQAAAHYNLATLIGDSRQTIAALAQATGTQEDWLYRVLRFLASQRIFAEVAPETFENTELSTCLRDAVPGSMRAMAMMMGSEHFRLIWSQLEACMRAGTSASELLFGSDIYTYFETHQEEGIWFEAALMNFSNMVSQALVSHYDFSRVQRLVDVGGGYGGLLEKILAHYPHVQGVLFEHPSLIEQVEHGYATQAKRVPFELVGGDFFVAVPAGADAYVLSQVLHNWSDERCLTILQQCRQAMHPSGVVLVCEQIVPPETDQGAFTKGLDLLMALQQQGRERSRAEFQRLFEAAGLSLTRIIPTGSPQWILEAVAQDHSSVA